jgi:hypothetical protein
MNTPQAAFAIRSQNIIDMDPDAEQVTPRSLEEIVDEALGERK